MFDPAHLYRAYRAPATPWLRVNFVASLDGAATVGGLSGGLNDPWDLQVFQTLRALSDVVVVGAGTIRAEAYDGVYLPPAHVAHRRGQGRSDHPRLAIVTDSADLDPTAAPFQTDGRKERPLVYAGAGADPARLAALGAVAEVVPCAGEHGPADQGVDVAAMVADLVARGLGQILCEGGPTLFGALLGADLIDELCLTLSPTLVGGVAGRITDALTETPRHLGRVHAMGGGAMLFLRYARLLGPNRPAGL